MPYRQLYSRRQAEATFLTRNWYIEDAKEVSWVAEGSLNIKVTDHLLKERVRGLIIWHDENFFPDLDAGYTIIIAEGLPQETERFVVIKELMHCYLGPFGGDYATSNPHSLESHMRALFGNSFTVRSRAYEAETKALWMALGVLTPENYRLQLRQEVLVSKVKTFENVAQELMIPVHTAKALLSKQFEDEIAHILK